MLPAGSGPPPRTSIEVSDPPLGRPMPETAISVMGQNYTD
jgi:hypothetical protein